MQDPTAVAGQRLLAFLIDTLVICVVIAVAWLLLVDKLPKEGVTGGGFDIGDKRYGFTKENQEKQTIWFLVSFATLIAVSVIPVGLKGSSPGRALAGVKVVNAQGERPGVGRAFVRWLLWIVDGLFFWAVGGILVLATGRHQRLGDMASSTYTVRNSHTGPPTGAGGQVQPGYGGQAQTAFQGQPQAGYQGQADSGGGAGWHPDPWGQARLRWWDGSEWTEHTSP